MEPVNKLGRYVHRINRQSPWLRSWLLTQLFGRAIKFAGTASVQVAELDFSHSLLKLKNKSKVQNHIGSVHAAAMSLLGESASGFLVGVHVPDDRIPLLKSMHLDYVKRASGDLTARAQLTAEQIDFIRSTEKGEISIKVQITDSVHVEPVLAEFVWAWVPKQRK
ncbi:DUF4442 domain-containing protein [Rheinheimera sp.]|uniref:DUF4442 domain-containing protein n=1 Tax=Rheinheimera sp. TaxID=1869214 RepID=UPI00307D11F9